MTSSPNGPNSVAWLRKTLVMTALSSLTSTYAAAAAEIPRFNVNGSCKQMAIARTGSQVSAADRDGIVNSCVAAQQDAYDVIKNEWGDLSEEQQALCLSQTAPTGNYRSMQYCVDAAYEVAQSRKRETPPSFRY